MRKITLFYMHLSFEESISHKTFNTEHYIYNIQKHV